MSTMKTEAQTSNTPNYEDLERTAHPTRFEALVEKVIATTAAFEGAGHTYGFGGTCYVGFRDGQTQYDMGLFKDDPAGIVAYMITLTSTSDSIKLLSETELVQFLSSIGGAQ